LGRTEGWQRRDLGERDLGFEGVGAVEDLQSGEGFESLGLGEVG